MGIEDTFIYGLRSAYDSIVISILDDKDAYLPSINNESVYREIINDTQKICTKKTSRLLDNTDGLVDFDELDNIAFEYNAGDSDNLCWNMHRVDTVMYDLERNYYNSDNYNISKCPELFTSMLLVYGAKPKQLARCLLYTFTFVLPNTVLSKLSGYSIEYIKNIKRSQNYKIPYYFKLDAFKLILEKNILANSSITEKDVEDIFRHIINNFGADVAVSYIIGTCGSRLYYKELVHALEARPGDNRQTYILDRHYNYGYDYDYKDNVVTSVNYILKESRDLPLIDINEVFGGNENEN